ncbi:hypothetical protein Avbf_10435 [Armadillidium vulgare]|nr:hypothetical protein Avbf_10435 [Armadillidium vulgare]
MERKLKENFSKLSLKFEKTVDKAVRRSTDVDRNERNSTDVDKNVRKFTKIDMRVKLESLFTRHAWDLREKYLNEISETSQKLKDKLAELERRSIVDDLETKLRIIFTNHILEVRNEVFCF